LSELLKYVPDVMKCEVSDCAFIMSGISGLIGKVDFTVRHLSSSTSSFPGSWQQFNSGEQCIGTGTRQVYIFFTTPFFAGFKVFFFCFSFLFFTFVHKTVLCILG
jgi:hypothetical protein